MADLLGAANPVPSYDNANHNRINTNTPRPTDLQVQNIPDPTRVGRPDARTDQQGANNALQSDIPRYDSNLQTFLQRMQEMDLLPELLGKAMLVLRGVISTPGLQQGIAKEMAQLMEMLKLDPKSLQQFFTEQLHGGNRFVGPLFSLLRQSYATLTGTHARQSILEFAQRYADFSSTAHIAKNMTSLLRQINDYLPKSWQGKLEEMMARLENGLAAGTRGENLRLIQGEIIPYLGSYVGRTHDMGPLRSLLNMLVLNLTRYENGSEQALLQSFRQLGGYSETLNSLNQLDDKAILKLLQENDFTRASGSQFAQTLSTIASKALEGAYGQDVREAFAEIVRAMLIQESVFLPLNHMLFPIDWNGQMTYGEAWVDPDADDPEGGSSHPERNKVQFLFKIDLESLGFLEISLAARKEQVELRVLGPEAVSSNSAIVAEDLRTILTDHGLTGKEVRVEKLEKPLTLTEVFPNLFEGKRGVNVKI